jgi:hypothetical protein
MVLALAALLFLLLVGEARADSPWNLGAFDEAAPTPPIGLRVAGGPGWRPTNDFTVEWADPGQGIGAPIAGAYLRLIGANGYDTGAQFYFAGTGITAIPGIHLPWEGDFAVFVWLRDEAGNENPGMVEEVHLDFDATPPALAFVGNEGDENREAPAQLVATFYDPLSGPTPGATGTISYRRAETTEYADLPTKVHVEDPMRATLTAPMPSLPPGNWVFRVEASDAAGNVGSSSLRADGTQMAFRVKGPEAPAATGGGGGAATGGAATGAHADPPPAGLTRTRLFVGLSDGQGRGATAAGATRSRDADLGRGATRGRGARRGGATLTVPFGAGALLAGRLTDADGAGLAGRRVRVVVRPSHGALAPRAVERVRTGARGGFIVRLGPGTSRRITVSFPGNDSLAPARHRPLDLRVRSGVILEAAPGTLRTGQSVRLRGRVRSRGAPIPRRGKLVAIQYLEADTGRWRPVLVTRTDREGRFRTHYQFRYIHGAARIRLRATALAEERWPYAPGSSAPVTIAVRGRY